MKSMYKLNFYESLIKSIPVPMKSNGQLIKKGGQTCNTKS